MKTERSASERNAAHKKILLKRIASHFYIKSFTFPKLTAFPILIFRFYTFCLHFWDRFLPPSSIWPLTSRWLLATKHKIYNIYLHEMSRTYARPRNTNSCLALLAMATSSMASEAGCWYHKYTKRPLVDQVARANVTRFAQSSAKTVVESSNLICKIYK